MELDGQIAVITGGAVGVGRVLAREGVRLAVHYHSSSAPAEETVAQTTRNEFFAHIERGDNGR